MYPKDMMVMQPRGSAPARHLVVLPLVVALVAIATVGCGHKSVLGPDGAKPVGAAAPTNLATPTCPRPLALHLEGRSASGARWAIDRPARWNGDLVVYAHGYVDPSLPIALPDYGPIRDSLLARGFAVAASSFSSNGYAVAEGVRETHELNGLFEARAGHARHTYVVGKSLGGLVGMILTQRFPAQYDGSLLISGIVGGSEAEVQYMGDIRVLFDAVYGPVLGGDLYHPLPLTDMNAQVVTPVMKAITANPQGLGVIQALARRPLPGATSQELVTSLITLLGFSVQGGGDLYARTHEHGYFDNATWHYDSPALPPAVVADINTRVARYARDPEAAVFLARWGQPSGPFSVPVLTMHTSRDPVVPFFHEDLLAQVAAGPNLRQHRTDRYGHVQYSVAEIVADFDELVRWAGTRGRELAGSDDDGRGKGARVAS